MMGSFALSQTVAVLLDGLQGQHGRQISQQAADGTEGCKIGVHPLFDLESQHGEGFARIRGERQRSAVLYADHFPLVDAIHAGRTAQREVDFELFQDPKDRFSLVHIEEMHVFWHLFPQDCFGQVILELLSHGILFLLSDGIERCGKRWDVQSSRQEHAFSTQEHVHGVLHVQVGRSYAQELLMHGEESIGSLLASGFPPGCFFCGVSSASFVSLRLVPSVQHRHARQSLLGLVQVLQQLAFGALLFAATVLLDRVLRRASARARQQT
mmetsp:Transcript_3715/g.23290  ORF Transcript_3715/g.23290 Transcript_3715/m.23290 type:complete len:268 (+) Transcript_3715:4757-5560(+)